MDFTRLSLPVCLTFFMIEKEESMGVVTLGLGGKAYWY